MRKDIIDILQCPMCRGTLELQIDQEQGDEVIQGSLKCTGECGEVYPIEDRIPDLRPPEMRAPAEAK
jgi:uncharacterized protein YbaR (Trm112 family)